MVGQCVQNNPVSQERVSIRMTSSEVLAIAVAVIQHRSGNEQFMDLLGRGPNPNETIDNAGNDDASSIADAWRTEDPSSAWGMA